MYVNTNEFYRHRNLNLKNNLDEELKWKKNLIFSVSLFNDAFYNNLTEQNNNSSQAV